MYNRNLVSSEILSSEVHLPDYLLFRKDRRRKGGGVAIYIITSLTPCLLNISNSIEFLGVSISLYKCKLNVCCFYCPPSSSSDISTSKY